MLILETISEQLVSQEISTQSCISEIRGCLEGLFVSNEAACAFLCRGSWGMLYNQRFLFMLGITPSNAVSESLQYR